MTLTLVTGGTGHLGRDIVDRLVRNGRRVRVFARSPGTRSDVEWTIGDLATGAGLRQALHDVDTVINAATCSPIAQRGGVRPMDFFRSPSAVDVEGTERLLSLSGKAEVRHFLHVSIVGLDEATLPYARVKLAGERLVRASALSWSVVRAMPFIICSTGCSRASSGFRYGRCRRRYSTQSTRPTLPTTSWLAPLTGSAASARRLAARKISLSSLLPTNIRMRGGCSEKSCRSASRRRRRAVWDLSLVRACVGASPGQTGCSVMTRDAKRSLVQPARSGSLSQTVRRKAAAGRQMHAADGAR